MQSSNGYSLRKWRLLDHQEASAAWNMAVDEVLLNGLSEPAGTPTLRVYQWTGFAVTVGRFQNLRRTVDMAVAERAGIPVVRRITGGRGIAHGDDLTLSVACSVEDLGLPSTAGISTIYSLLTGVVRSSFAQSGLLINQGPIGIPNTTEDSSRLGDCFASVTEADLLDPLSGSKVMGGALHKRGDKLLLQASILLRSPAKADKIEFIRSKILRNPVAAEQDAPNVDSDELRMSLIGAFARLCGGNWTRQELNAQELEAVKYLVLTRYQSADWTNRTTNREAGCAIDTQSAV